MTLHPQGTILRQDYAAALMVQTAERPHPAEVPVDDMPLAVSGGLAYLIDRLERQLPIEGPSSWEVSRSGQQIVDAAALSALVGREIRIADVEGAK
jgi:hypothetical protein